MRGATVSASQPLYGHATRLVDGDDSTAVMAMEPTGLTVDFTVDLGAAAQVAPEMWGLARSEASTEGVHRLDPSRWVFLASNDAETWVNVSVRADLDRDIWPSAPSGFRGAYPSELGQTVCSPADVSGCGWGSTFTGSLSVDSSYLLAPRQVYPSWTACQHRCCSDHRCRAAAFDSATGLCTTLARGFELEYERQGTMTMANLASRVRPDDGWAVKESTVDDEGTHLVTYEGHRSVAWCKQQCNAEPRCHSFSWSESRGCSLKTACVSESATLERSAGYSAPSFVTWYQLYPTACSSGSGRDYLDNASALQGDCSTVEGAEFDDQGSELFMQHLNGTEESLVGDCCALCRADSGCNFWQFWMFDAVNVCKGYAGVGRLRTYRGSASVRLVAGFVAVSSAAIAAFALPTSPFDAAPPVAPSRLGPGAYAGPDPLGFAYLEEAETPYVSSVSVTGAVRGASGQLSALAGDQIVLTGGNFDAVVAGDVEVHLGASMCSVSSLSATEVRCTAQAASHAVVQLKLMVGWKGWANFRLAAGDGDQDHFPMLFGGGMKNRLSGSEPKAGSIFGGLLRISGQGFLLPARLNSVVLQRSGAANLACDVTSATVQTLECMLPGMSRSGWGQVQTQERVSVIVNGVASVDAVFTYDTQKTPVAEEVLPSALPYAVSAPVTIVGYRFGVIREQIAVRFGDRPCRVREVSETRIVCLLTRSPRNASALGGLLRPSVTRQNWGLAEQLSGAVLDTRFEIHGVTPASGSEKGGARVTIAGTGFGSPQARQRRVAVAGALASVVSWSPTEIVLTTPKATSNANLVEVSVNQIEAVHLCGVGRTPAPCRFAALQAGATPTVASLSRNSGRAGDTIDFVVDLPAGASPSRSDVEVRLGPHTCQLGSAFSVSSGQARFQVTVPQFAASAQEIGITVRPFGLAAFAAGASSVYESLLVLESVTPNTGSFAGRTVVIRGAGFAAGEPARHFVRIGSRDFGMCAPSSASYSELTCRATPVKADVDEDIWTDSYAEDVAVSVWDGPIAREPRAAFGAPLVKADI